MMKKTASAFLATLILIGLPSLAHAQAVSNTPVSSLQFWNGNSGVLVRVTQTMPHPDGCGRSDWYILADSDPHYEESYALLLTAMASGPKVNIWVSGCFETFPKIINLLGARP